MLFGRSALRRWCAVACVALAALLGTAACTSSHSGLHLAQRTDNRPNIVFVLTDDLASNLVPYMPHVRALQLAGATFPNYFVVDSLCCPSRAAIFTGLYPHNNGVFNNSGPDGGLPVYNRHGDPQRSFAVALHNAGYFTGFMGKYLNLYQPGMPSAPGWDEWDVAGDGYPEYDYSLNENGTLKAYGHDPSDYLTGVLSQKAVDFVHQAGENGKPFALEVAPFAPHRPWVPAPLDNGAFPTLKAPRTPAFDRRPTHAPHWLSSMPKLRPADIRLIDDGFRRRVAMVQAVDRMIGQIERALIAIHQLKNTYIVFSSDNGFHMGDYGLMPGKQTAFDTDIRVPLVVAGPGVRHGSRIDSLASSIDLAPTFLQIAGARPVAEPDGVSLLSLLHGAPAPSNWQRAVLVEHHGPVLNASDPDVQPTTSGDPPDYEAMRTRDALYVEYATGEREYYDLRKDPYEVDNIAGSLSPAQLAVLHATLRGLAQCRGATDCQRAAAPSGV